MIMLNTIWTTLQANVAAFSEWWDGVPTAYRAAGCMLFALLLMWEATKGRGEKEHDRKFFLQGLLALLILVYGAVLFTSGNGASP